MTRFEPTRAGIVNLWDYRDEEFCFAGGWLVLRGPNGSGKTKALEVFFPFVLDGRIDPKRLNLYRAKMSHRAVDLPVFWFGGSIPQDRWLWP